MADRQGAGPVMPAQSPSGAPLKYQGVITEVLPPGWLRLPAGDLMFDQPIGASGFGDVTRVILGPLLWRASKIAMERRRGWLSWLPLGYTWRTVRHNQPKGPGRRWVVTRGWAPTERLAMKAVATLCGRLPGVDSQ